MKSKHSPWRNPWIISWIGLVVIVLLVNIVMVYLSATTGPGLVVDDYYERGQAFEKTRLQRQIKDQDVLLRLNVPTEILHAKATTIRLVAVDRNGQPLRSDRVRLFAYRPSDAAADFSAPMSAEATGRFSVQVQFPLKGIWDLIVSVDQNGKEHNIASRINALSSTEK